MYHFDDTHCMDRNYSWLYVANRSSPNMTNNDDKTLELLRQITWLEKRYSEMVKAIADTVAETVPPNLQKKFFLTLVKKTEAIKRNDPS